MRRFKRLRRSAANIQNKNCNAREQNAQSYSDGQYRQNETADSGCNFTPYPQTNVPIDLQNQNSSGPTVQSLNSSDQRSGENIASTINQNPPAKMRLPIYKKLENNVEYIKRVLGNPNDLIIRELTLEITDVHQSEQKNWQKNSQKPNKHLQIQVSIPQEKISTSTVEDSVKIRCSIFYISGMANSKIVDDNILKTLQSNPKQYKGDVLEQIYQEFIAVTETKKIKTLEQVIHALLSGNSIMILEGKMTALEMGTAGAEKRALVEPQSETLIRGPRVAFIEDIETNITLIRGELKDSNLRFKIYEVGRRSKQKIAVCYVEGIINPEILNEVNRRLKTIDIDFASDSGVVEQWIEDSFLSPFPQVLDTERPDRVSYNLMQGKFAILVDGSPFALIAPVTIGDALLTIEDYSQRWIIGTSMRLLRYFSLFIALFLPALYVALTAYHPGMIPTHLTLSIAANRESGPFPAIIEVLLMAVTFEILQEAGIRLPKVIGQTIGIVGGIVIGDVAVSAGLVGPSLVIVTSLTAMSSYTIPNYSLSIGLRILRFLFVIAASIFGLYGIILVFIMLCIHIVNLKSMGIPYSAPFSPNFIENLKNLLIRAPIMTIKKRPPYLEPLDMQKVNSGGQQQ